MPTEEKITPENQIMDAITALTAKIDQIGVKVNEIDTLKEMIADTNSNLSNITVSLNNLKVENSSLKAQINSLTLQNSELQNKINNLDQYNRKNNVIIQGIPVVEGENVREQVMRLAKRLKVEIFDYDINATHRLPSRENAIPPIIVRLNNREKKSALVANSKKLRLRGDDSSQNSSVPIFVNDHLTKLTSELLHKAKQAQREGKVSHAWCREGNIFVRLNEQSPSIRIFDSKQLSSLYQTTTPPQDDVSEESEDVRDQEPEPRISTSKNTRKNKTKKKTRQLTLEQHFEPESQSITRSARLAKFKSSH